MNEKQDNFAMSCIVPKVGQFTYCNGVACRIVEVYPYGTIKVRGIENADLYFIVSGLPFTSADLFISDDLKGAAK